VTYLLVTAFIIAAFSAVSQMFRQPPSTDGRRPCALLLIWLGLW